MSCRLWFVTWFLAVELNREIMGRRVSFTLFSFSTSAFSCSFSYLRARDREGGVRVAGRRDRKKLSVVSLPPYASRW